MHHKEQLYGLHESAVAGLLTTLKKGSIGVETTHGYVYGYQVPDYLSRERIFILTSQPTAIDGAVEAVGGTVRLLLTDQRGATLSLDVSAEHGVLGIASGQKTASVARLIFDAHERIAEVAHGIRPGGAHQWVLAMGDAQLVRYATSENLDAACYFQSEYAVTRNDKAQSLLYTLRGNHGRAIVADLDRPISFSCTTVYRQNRPLFLWVVPTKYEDAHHLVHGASDHNSVPLLYTRMSILSMVYVDHAGNLALTAGNAKRTGTIKHERIVYPFGGFPVCAVNENRRVFPVQGIPEPLVPVVFQGCVLQVNEQQFSAVLLEDASLYQAFNASL